MELDKKEMALLFWASFTSLAAAGFGFAFRIAHMGSYGEEFGLTGQQIGNIAGSCFWPIAITMILFSLVVDKTGYKVPMVAAALLQAISGVGTGMAQSYEHLLLAAICAGLGHGIIEAVINPLCAAAYPKQKTKMLTILHAAWPAGIVSGTLLILVLDGVIEGGISWRVHALWIAIPALAYGFLYLRCKAFPVDERVAAGVPFKDMLKEVGFLGASLASFMLIYQIGGVLSGIFGLFPLPDGDQWFFGSLIGGLVVGAIFGGYVKSFGKPLFFLLCLLMIPVATAELSTDNWIKELMGPVLSQWEVNGAWAIIFSAGIMLALRLYAGGILKFFNPPMLMATSGVLSAVGLFWLGSGAAGAMIFIAFTIYAIGQTYYWPCILGFVSEQYPKGGALTLNTVSALALLSLGMVGNPILGVARDQAVYKKAKEQMPEVTEVATGQSDYLWMTNDVIVPDNIALYGAKKVSGQSADILGALGPIIEADEALTAKRDELKAGLGKLDAEVLTNLGISEEDVEAVKTYSLVAGGGEELVAKANEALAAEAKAGLTSYTDAVAKHGEIQQASGRDVLIYAARFPAILVISFAIIAIYFKSQGGYKPVILNPEADPEELAAAIEHEEHPAPGEDADEHTPM
jgi:MFS family permease